LCSLTLGYTKKQIHIAPQTSDKNIVIWILHKNILGLIVTEPEKIIFGFKNLTVQPFIKGNCSKNFKAEAN